MTASIPNGFSPDELQAMLSNARHEDDCRCESCEPDSKTQSERTQQEIEEFAQAKLNEAGEYSRGPVIHKVMVLMALHRFIEWHTVMGEEECSSDPKAAIAWLRDAGNLQAAFNTLLDVSFGPDDFTFSAE